MQFDWALWPVRCCVVASGSPPLVIRPHVCVQHRLKVIKQLAQFGGTPCPATSTLQDVKTCAIAGTLPAVCNTTCTDGIIDNGETGVDCGGTSKCGACSIGGTCLANSDCSSGLVCGNAVCVCTYLCLRCPRFAASVINFGGRRIDAVCSVCMRAAKIVASSMFFLGGSYTIAGATTSQLQQPDAELAIRTSIASAVADASGIAVVPNDVVVQFLYDSAVPTASCAVQVRDRAVPSELLLRYTCSSYSPCRAWLRSPRCWCRSLLCSMTRHWTRRCCRAWSLRCLRSSTATRRLLSCSRLLRRSRPPFAPWPSSRRHAGCVSFVFVALESSVACSLRFAACRTARQR